MPVFADAEELHRFIGGAMRAAATHPEIATPLAAAGLSIEVHYSDPDATAVVRFDDPITVEDGGLDAAADVVLRMPGDLAHRYWSGEYHLGVGIARGKIQAEGAVDAFLALLPLLKPMFPAYRKAYAAREAPSGRAD